MVDYELSIHIDRPAPDVFEYVTNTKNMPQWATYIQEATLTPDGPIGVGSQIHQIVRGREVIWKVTAYEPNSLCKYEADYWYASNAETTFRVEAIPTGTKFTVHDKGDPKGLMRLLTPLRIDYRVRKKQMAIIKKVLEG